MSVDGTLANPLTFVNTSARLILVEKLTVLPERERGVCCPPTLKTRPLKIEQTTEILKALADPTRLQIALCLRDAKEPVCICDFTATFDISQPTVSHHMAKLREAGLVDVTKQGIWSFYRLASDLSPATRRILDAIG
jgi:ArsR family transcriptional regulator